MKVAFLILAHKNPDQLRKLLKRLNSSASIFFIHIDKKVDILPFKLATEEFKNLVWVDREDGRWGDIGIVKASINCLSRAVEDSNIYSHYVLLSGQDYPLKNINDIINFFNNNKETSFIEHHPFPVKELNYSGLDRTQAYSTNIYGKRHTAIPLSWRPKFNLKGQILNIILLILHLAKGKRKHPEGITPFYGSQWWAINHNVAKEIITRLKHRPDFLKYHKSTILPDEVFFQSIVGSIKNTLTEGQIVVNNNLHYIDWHQQVSHPKVLNLKDYEKLISSGNLFARKFELPESDKLIQKLNEEG